MPPKGKQGTKGLKQIEEENASTLKFYLYIILGVNVTYFILQCFLFWDSFTGGIITLSVFAVALNFGCYQFMSHMAGSKIDLNMSEGMSEHAKDILLYTCIVQSLSIISNYFWLIWLVIPGRAFYLLWVNILGPWFFAPAPEQDEKKQKKLERKMKRH
ncbi:transmembrane protein 208-like [Mytilus californianus]|uniref:transmembrane protein 208-like n=1 Tax=Mytilus californianus TaxID=6549 RepID=UPI0022476A46|nr:transmembrane protein 208-like [Mytilus californianus]